MRRNVAILSALLLTSVACGVPADGPPEIQVDRTACSHCRMLVSEPRYAAAYRAPGAEALVFDDIQCLLDAARKEPGPVRLWFRDASGDSWIDGADEHRVRPVDPAVPGRIPEPEPKRRCFLAGRVQQALDVVEHERLRPWGLVGCRVSRLAHQHPAVAAGRAVHLDLRGTVGPHATRRADQQQGREDRHVPAHRRAPLPISRRSASPASRGAARSRTRCSRS